jgi:Meckel syndrome type 1 protein
VTVVALRRPSPPDSRLLQRCLLLAVLLHVWLVLMFGNAAGTAAPGQGVWGSLTVKLLGRSGGDASAPPGETGSGHPQRTGAGEPGAAQVGRHNPQDVPPDAARTDEASPAPANTATLDLPEGFRPIEHQDLSPAPRSAPAQLPAPELPSASVGRLDTRPDAAVAPLAPATNLRTPGLPAALPVQPADLPSPVNRLDAAPTPATAELPRAADLRLPPAPTAVAPGAELPPPVSRLEAPPPVGATAALPRPAELRAAPAPTTAVPGTELPPPVRRLEAPAPTATTSLPRPADLRAAPATTPALTPPTPLPSPVQRLESAGPDGAAVTPLSRASELRAPATVASPSNVLQGAQDLPNPVRRLEAADGSAGVAPLQPSPTARAAKATTAPDVARASELSGTLPGQVAAPAGPARGDPTANPYAAPRASVGSPEAGSRLGPDLPSPPSAASTPARAPLNLSLPRGEMSARRNPGAIDLIPPPPERKSKMEQSVEDATKKDCRKAYEGMGLLAVIPLAADAARDKGCKW